MTQEQLVLTKMARTGQQITVKMQEVYPGSYRLLTYIADKCVASGNLCKLEPAQGAVTHVIQSGKIGVGFTTPEAEIILAAIAQAKADFATSPQGQQQALRRERDALVAAIDGATAQAKADFESLHARQDDRCWQVRAEGEIKIRTAIATLSNWDEVHPEVIAQIRAEQSEQTQRFLESN